MNVWDLRFEPASPTAQLPGDTEVHHLTTPEDWTLEIVWDGTASRWTWRVIDTEAKTVDQGRATSGNWAKYAAFAVYKDRV